MPNDSRYSHDDIDKCVESVDAVSATLSLGKMTPGQPEKKWSEVSWVGGMLHLVDLELGSSQTPAALSRKCVCRRKKRPGDRLEGIRYAWASTATPNTFRKILYDVGTDATLNLLLWLNDRYLMHITMYLQCLNMDAFHTYSLCFK